MIEYYVSTLLLSWSKIIIIVEKKDTKLYLQKILSY